MQIDELVGELMEMQSENHNYTEPQYRLWARMIQNGIQAFMIVLTLESALSAGLQSGEYGGSAE